MEYDDLNDIMMEATDNSIAAMFIEEDGEAVISDSEVMSILEKIPDYDEEAAMNKKLARIAEAYIPEELEYIEEGVINRFRMRKWSKDDLQEEINNLKDEINELENKENRDKKDDKRLKKAKKELADAEHLLNVKSERDEEVRESYDYDDEEMLEEGFASKKMLKNYSEEQLEEKMRNLENEIEDLNHVVNSDEGTKKDKKRLEKAKKELADVERLYKWMREQKTEATSESWDDYEEDYEDDFLYEAFGLEKLKKKKVDVEVIYDDDVAQCVVRDIEGNDLETIEIDLPEKFHAGEDDGTPVDKWNKNLVNHARKSIKKQLSKKGYKINKIFKHE
jgi:DNA repair exonuclease SbcCD ATPase subunit